VTTANLAGRLLFLVGSLVFLGLALARDRPGMALGSALFVAGSVLFLALQVRQLRHEQRDEEREVDERRGVRPGAPRTEE
jgi:uncharacterized membrane protein YhhN